MSDKVLALKTVAFASFFALAFSALTLYKLECNPLDKSFADFEYCELKPINRTLKFMSLKVNLFKVPITNISVRVAASYRANGWKPFLYNYTINACKFLKEKNRNLFVNHFYKTFLQFSNMNHTCPYSHDVIVTNLSTSFVERVWTIELPTPEGQYRLETVWFAYGIPRAEVFIYCKIS